LSRKIVSSRNARRVGVHVGLEPEAEADVLDRVDGLRVFEDFFRQGMELRRDVLHAVQHAERTDFLHAAVRFEMKRRRVNVQAARLLGLRLRRRDEILLRLFLRRLGRCGRRRCACGRLLRLRFPQVDVRVVAVVNLELPQERMRALAHLRARTVRRLARVELVDLAVHEIDGRQYDVRDG